MRTSKISFICTAVLFLSSQLAFSRPVKLKCNKKQKECELEDRRLTVGDKVGVFSPEGHLHAVGEVIEIKGEKRIVKIKKRYSKILKKHRAQIIKDKEAKSPKKYFTVAEAPAEWEIGGNAGLYFMEVGDGFSAFTLEGIGQWNWRKHTYFYGKFGLLSGSGKASAKLQSINSTSVDVSAYMLSGGIYEIFFPYEVVSLRTGASFGFAQTSISLGADASVSDVLNNRIVDGTVLLFGGEATAIYKWKKYKPTLSIHYLSLHRSTNIGFSVGITSKI